MFATVQVEISEMTANEYVSYIKHLHVNTT